MSLWSVFVTGLFSGGASCAAVQGGLLAGVVARRRDLGGTGGPPPTTDGATRRGQAGALVEATTPAAPAPAVVALVGDAAKPSPADDALPVASFLAGKLVSHVAFGALLGAFGAALQPDFRARAYMQIGAGALMIVMALSLFGVLPQWLPSPPRRVTRLVRRSARGETAFAPALLGFLTVLVPCGVTLSMEVLAISTGSPLAGAATLGAFVVGTSPLFATIGYVVRRSSVVLRGHLTKLAAAAVVVAGLLSINSGLVLNGSSVTLAKVAPQVSQALPQALGGGQVTPPPTSSDHPVALADVDASGLQRVVISVSEGRMDGTAYPFNPSIVRAKAGMPTELVLQTGGSLGCAASIVIPRRGIEKVLTPSSEVTVDLGTPSEGEIDFTCGAGMYSGAIQVVS